MNDTEWLKTLAAGDAVIVRDDYQRVELREVEKVTTTQIVVGGNGYNRGNGYKRGNGWIHNASSFNRTRLVKPTDELIEKANRRMLLQKINAATLERCSTDQLRRIVAILNEGTTP